MARMQSVGWMVGVVVAITLCTAGASFATTSANLNLPAYGKAQVMQMVADEAVQNGRVPVALALGVARVESNFNPTAVSAAGARGVMQIMPSTAMGEFGVPRDQLFDPRLNIRLGVSYLERLYNQYGDDWMLALSHYNGGTLPVVQGRYVPHDYTASYVALVMRWTRTYDRDGTALALAGHDPAGASAFQVASVAPDAGEVGAWSRFTYDRPNPALSQAFETTEGQQQLSSLLQPSQSAYPSGAPEQVVPQESSVEIPVSAPVSAEVSEPVSGQGGGCRAQEGLGHGASGVIHRCYQPTGRFSYAPFHYDLNL